MAWFRLEDLGALIRVDDTVTRTVVRVLRADLVVTSSRLGGSTRSVLR